MSASGVTARCPHCGTGLVVDLRPSPPTQWFPCPRCHSPVPVLVPRDLPPLYSWEVVPGLYPQLNPPRLPRWSPSSVASIVLAVAAAMAVLTAGVLGYEGVVAAEPGSYTVSGIVLEPRGGGYVPAYGATVVLSSNGQVIGSTVTGPGGAFRFPSVPVGGIEINASAPGFNSTVVYTFASHAYSTQTQGLELTLEPGAGGNVSVTALTPFVDLETLLAYVGGSATLALIAAGAAAAGAVAFRRPRQTVVAVIGAGAAVTVPVVLVVLLVSTAFPLATVTGGIAGGAGGFALLFAVAELVSRPPPDEAPRVR